jgi:hypothetical protein
MLLVQSQMSSHKIASNADLPHLVSAWAGFSISPQVISIVDTGLGQRSVTEDIEAVLRKIEYWYQGSIDGFKVMCRDGKGFWHRANWDGKTVSFFALEEPVERVPWGLFSACWSYLA